MGISSKEQTNMPKFQKGHKPLNKSGRAVARPAVKAAPSADDIAEYLKSQGLAVVATEALAEEGEEEDEDGGETRRGPGRPKGSKNRPKASQSIVAAPGTMQFVASKTTANWVVFREASGEPSTLYFPTNSELADRDELTITIQ